MKRTFHLPTRWGRAHAAKDTVAYLKDNVPEMIKPENWPPNSSDLNPADYSIWENLSQRVYEHHRIRDVQHLNDDMFICSFPLNTVQ